MPKISIFPMNVLLLPSGSQCDKKFWPSATISTNYKITEITKLFSDWLKWKSRVHRALHKDK